MSIDLSALKSKTEFMSNNNLDAPTVPENEDYNSRLARVQQHIIRFFDKTGGNSSENRDLQIRTDFLNTTDKDALIAAIEGKGYTCVESTGVMSIN